MIKGCSVRNGMDFLRRSVLVLLASVASSFVVIKETHAFSPPAWRSVIAIGGGAYFTSNTGESQTFPIQDPDTDEFYEYAPTHNSQTAGLYNAFVGVEWRLLPNWLLQTGFDYNQTSSLYTNGVVTQGADVQSEDIYNYHYNIVTRQLLLAGKLLYTLKQRYHPYVLVGLGAAFNQASNYSTNVPPFLTFTRMYQDNNNTSFSYAAGVGVDVDLTDNLRFGIGYRYADLGQVKLGAANIDVNSVSGTLSQSNLYANQLLAQLTLVI